MGIGRGLVLLALSNDEFVYLVPLNFVK